MSQYFLCPFEVLVYVHPVWSILTSLEFRADWLCTAHAFTLICVCVTKKWDKEGQDRLPQGLFLQVRVCVCMLLSTYAFLFEPCVDIKCGLTMAHCPVSPAHFLSCQNSRKLGHRANKQWWPPFSAGTSGPSGGTLARTAGVGGRNPARKLISVASLLN